MPNDEFAETFRPWSVEHQIEHCYNTVTEDLEIEVDDWVKYRSCYLCYIIGGNNYYFLSPGFKPLTLEQVTDAMSKVYDELGWLVGQRYAAALQILRLYKDDCFPMERLPFQSDGLITVYRVIGINYD